MKQFAASLAIAAVAFGTSPLQAQDACASLAAPSVGQWSQYDMRQPDGRVVRTRFSIVGTERHGDSAFVWLESQHTDEGGTALLTSKVLVPGFPYAGSSIRAGALRLRDGRVVEMTEQQLERARTSAPRVIADLASGCRSVSMVGTDSVDVPAGRVAARHFRNPSGTLHIWVSEQVPFGLVKYTNSGDRTEFQLRASGTGAKTEISAAPR